MSINNQQTPYGYVAPVPGDNYVDEAKAGEYQYRAGDRTRRLKASAARREADLRRKSDPVNVEKNTAAWEKHILARHTTAEANALTAVDRLKKRETALRLDLAEAQDNARHLHDPAEATASLREAARHQAALSQIPAALQRAEDALSQARAQTAAFQQTVADRLSLRAEDDKAAAALADLERRALDAAEAAYHAFLRENGRG